MEYKVGVSIQLIDRMTGGIGAITKSLYSANSGAAALHKKMQQIGATLMIAQKAGEFGAEMFHGSTEALGQMIDKGMQFNQVLNQMEMKGLKQKDIADAVANAWKNTSIPASTVNDNLKHLMDLQAVFGSMQEAKTMLPAILNARNTIIASGDMDKLFHGNMHAAESQLLQGARALDKMGAPARGEEFTKEQFDKMRRSIVMTNNQVKFDDFYAVAQMEKSAGLFYDDEYRYKIAPTFMLENKNKGGSAFKWGTQEANFYKSFVQGVMKPEAVQGLANLGIVDTLGRKITKDNKGQILKEGLIGGDLARTNPFKFAELVYAKILSKVPSISDIRGKSAQETDFLQRRAAVAKFGAIPLDRQTSGAMSSFIVQHRQAVRDEGLWDKTKSGKELDKASNKSPAVQLAAAKAAFDNLYTVLGVQLIPKITPFVQKFSNALNGLAGFFKEHPGLAKMAVIGVVASAVAGGLAMVAAPMIALGATLVALEVPIAAIAGGFLAAGLAAGALWLGAVNLIKTLWDWDKSMSQINKVWNTLPDWIRGGITGAIDAAKNFAIQLPSVLGTAFIDAVKAFAHITGPTVATNNPFRGQTNSPTYNAPNSAPSTPIAGRGRLLNPDRIQQAPAKDTKHISYNNTVGDIHIHQREGEDQDKLYKRLLSDLNRATHSTSSAGGIFNTAPA